MEMQPTPLHSALAIGLELAINTALKADPSSRKKLSELAERSLEVQCSQPDLSFQIVFCENSILVNGNPQNKSDAKISGTVSSFLQIATSQNHHSLAATGLSVEGNANLLTSIQNIAKQLEIDWEDLLTPIGPPALTHTVASGLKSIGSLIQRNKTFVEQNLSSVLADELQCIPSELELSQFYDEVDNIAARAQRLDARIAAFIKQNN